MLHKFNCGIYVYYLFQVYKLKLIEQMLNTQERLFCSRHNNLYKWECTIQYTPNKRQKYFSFSVGPAPSLIYLLGHWTDRNTIVRSSGDVLNEFSLDLSSCVDNLFELLLGMASIHGLLTVRRCNHFIRQFRAIPSLPISSLRGGVTSPIPVTRAAALPTGQLVHSNLLHQATPATNSIGDDSRSERSRHTSERGGGMAPPEKQEGWVRGKPTRAIASKLLDMPDHMAESHALYTQVAPSGLFRSRRHFKQCVKILRAMDRVDMVCHGPLQTSAPTSGSSLNVAKVPPTRPRRSRKVKLHFSIALTGKGRHVYSYYRRVTDRYGQENADPSTDDRSSISASSPSPVADSKIPSATSSPGLSDAL